MYLKALEIQGFKSFPEKTRLTFERDITAIVGPNGSGKSNIADAIQWVLGEQRTRALRGGRMEDVVFGGTEKRGSMGFAQATLILDNSGRVFDTDNSEVMLTRRCYRSGESEYYLNRRSVRLRDITELLMDTGLGRDGYSIIGQGRIDEILSAKSADRRELFEEAAGISRFRHRREESERKLLKTDENLLRVNDKIDELELQAGPLREQADKARRYLLLRDELRTLEVSVWMEKLDVLRAQAEAAEAEHSRARGELQAAHAELERIYARAEALTEKMREKDAESELTRERAAQAEAAASECESAAAVLRAKLRGNADAIDSIRRELSEQEDLTATLSSQIDERRARIAELERSRGELAREYDSSLTLSEANSRRSAERAEELKRLLRAEAAENEEAARCATLLTALADAAQALLDRDSESAAELARCGERQEAAEKALEEAKAALKSSGERVGELKNIIAGYEMRLSGREKRAGELSERATRLTIDLRSMDSRVAMLTEMEKDYEGYSKAVKTVMRAKERGAARGVHGPVANLLRTDSRFTLAIETALGAGMQNIIVDTQADAKSAIELLKRSDAGRATFLPIDVIKPYELRNPPVGESGYLGLASGLIEHDKCYAGIFSNLLGRTAVVETLSDAVRLAKKYDNRFRVVSLDGQVVNVGGSMTGGSAARNAGVLSRANELERLRVERVGLAERLQSCEGELKEARRELDAVKYELSLALGELREAQDDALRRQAAASHQSEMLDSLSASAQTLREEKKRLAERESENEERVRLTREEAARRESKAAELRAELEGLSRDARELEARRAEFGERLSELRAKTASIDAEREAAARSIEELEGLRRGVFESGGERTRAIAELGEKSSDLEVELAARQLRLGELRARAADFKAELARVTEQRLTLEGERTRAERAGQEKNRELLELERVTAGFEQKKLAADLEEKQIIDRLWDSYELSRTAANARRQPLESVAGANRRIGELKRDMSALGTPNLGAIDEFARVSERLSFLSEQRDDVEKAKRELQRIIADVTREMREIFAREFKLIDESFRQTFLELFGGGRAELRLENESDVLEGGIDIRVQPPGKAVSTITLLSGGERAFVAIALYFAIIKIRPTPFCVMDEIEAALDEANVTRFADYMRAMSKKTQFIVITHRRGTMEEADALYGVTMQEKGVSTVIGVDLESAEKNAGLTGSAGKGYK